MAVAKLEMVTSKIIQELQYTQLLLIYLKLDTENVGLDVGILFLPHTGVHAWDKKITPHGSQHL